MSWGNEARCCGRAAEVSLWEAVLPDEILRLPQDLAGVDALPDDPAFSASFVPFFDPRLGRPSTPMEVYLRLMFLMFRYRLGYESSCREVADSITWRRFCRIPWTGGCRTDHTDEVDHPLRERCGGRAATRPLLAIFAQHQRGGNRNGSLSRTPNHKQSCDTQHEAAQRAFACTLPTIQESIRGSVSTAPK
jgi:hypothetical protein